MPEVQFERYVFIFCRTCFIDVNFEFLKQNAAIYVGFLNVKFGDLNIFLYLCGRFINKNSRQIPIIVTKNHEGSY